MRNKTTILTFLAYLISLSMFSQPTDQIAQNGGFENGIGYPIAQNQLDGLCNYWTGGALSTPDWYTTQNLPGALRGPCNFESGDDQTISSAQPKIATHDNSLFYGGFGSTEHARNELSRATYPFSLVKVSFWYSPRGTERATRIGVIMVDTDNTDNQTITFIDCVPNDDLLSCEWYYFESDWILLEGTTYEQVQIGGMAPPNNSGAFNEKGYIYIDDVNVYNGQDCCPTSMRYENTSNLTSETFVKDFIEAGFDAGISGMDGDVNIVDGQSVAFQAGNSIQLNAGFNVQSGANFSAVIQDCTPFTEPDGSQVVIDLVPNVMTPNGDGINDELCFIVSGAYYYHVQIFSRYGTANEDLEYENDGFVTSNMFCVWNGGGNVDGTYYFIVTFSNCDNSQTVSGFFSLFSGGGERIMNPEIQKNDSLFLYPNPTNSTVTVSGFDPSTMKIEVVNSLGQSICAPAVGVYKDNATIDLSCHGEGVYYILIIAGSKSECMRVVVLNK